MSISATKFQAMHKSLTAIAQKVYAAVPASEPWSVSFIHSEIQRNGGTTRDYRVVQGCLSSLKDSGLISEPQRGVFIRVGVKPEKETIVQSNPIGIPVATNQTPVVRSPMVILSDISTRFRELADAVDTAALEIDELFTAKSAGAEKLAQLQQLLKSIG
jgi:hypothetical protein